MAVYVDAQNYAQALSLASPLLKELKMIDDKALLVEVGERGRECCIQKMWLGGQTEFFQNVGGVKVYTMY